MPTTGTTADPVPTTNCVHSLDGPCFSKTGTNPETPLTFRSSRRISQLLLRGETSALEGALLGSRQGCQCQGPVPIIQQFAQTEIDDSPGLGDFTFAMIVIRTQTMSAILGIDALDKVVERTRQRYAEEFDHVVRGTSAWATDIRAKKNRGASKSRSQTMRGSSCSADTTVARSQFG